MGRALTFSDDRVIQLLKDFVPVAYDRHKAELHPRDGYFWQIVRQTPTLRSWDWRIESFPAAQGCYIFDSEGTTYAKANDHADVIVEMLKRAKRAFDKKKLRPRTLASTDLPSHPSPPADALVARVYSRISPVPKGCHSLNRALGRDVIWIPRREVEALLDGEFPQSLSHRLTLAHLRDNVRGEPGLWDLENIERAEFHAKVRKSDDGVRVEIQGDFRISSPQGTRGPENHWAGPSGYEGKLRGELVFDSKTRTVTRFVMYAEGGAWGEVRFTPGAPQGTFPLKIGFVLAGASDLTARVTPPYGADFEGNYLRNGIPGR